MNLGEITRREIIDALVTAEGGWSGRLQEDQFLSRLYDLEKLPSKDHRFRTASQDIWKHRVINTDWEDEWVFDDDRFNLRWAPDEVFLRFICEAVHPLIRPDSEQARTLVNLLNTELRKDGWELFECKKISGRPIFAARKLGGRVEIFEEPTGWPKVDRQLDKVRSYLLEASAEEHFQTVGLLGREVLISLAQAVYDSSRHRTAGDVEPSSADAGKMLDAVVSVELRGPANEEARSHAKAALRLALALQHNRTANFRTAALCAEATTSVVNILRILSGSRIPVVQPTSARRS